MTDELSSDERELLDTQGRQLLREAGLDERSSFERLAGGKNNRVYRVRGNDTQAIAKWYFHHHDDQRDRLHAEYSFCEFARQCGMDSVAKPLARSNTDRLAIYSWMEGRPLTASGITTSHVDQAIQFLRHLNDCCDAGAELPIASEACFSLRQHVECVTRRVVRLASIPLLDSTHEVARRLVNDRLMPLLARHTDDLSGWAASQGVDLARELAADQRCISPSDFGFHNALVMPDGRLAFVDFEYAGWDDPAKTICDFYCQPKLPAPRESWQRFAELCTELAGGTDLEVERQTALLPLYQIKWCCILLNEFAAADNARRHFATQEHVDLKQQLDKATQLAAQLSS